MISSKRPASRVSFPGQTDSADRSAPAVRKRRRRWSRGTPTELTQRKGRPFPRSAPYCITLPAGSRASPSPVEQRREGHRGRGLRRAPRRGIFGEFRGQCKVMRKSGTVTVWSRKAQPRRLYSTRLYEYRKLRPGLALRTKRCAAGFAPDAMNCEMSIRNRRNCRRTCRRFFRRVGSCANARRRWNRPARRCSKRASLHRPAARRGAT